MQTSKLPPSSCLHFCEIRKALQSFVLFFSYFYQVRPGNMTDGGGEFSFC